MLFVAVVFAASCGQPVSTQNEASETAATQGDSIVADSTSCIDDTAATAVAVSPIDTTVTK